MTLSARKVALRETFSFQVVCRSGHWAADLPIAVEAGATKVTRSSIFTWRKCGQYHKFPGKFAFRFSTQLQWIRIGTQPMIHLALAAAGADCDAQLSTHSHLYPDMRNGISALAIAHLHSGCSWSRRPCSCRSRSQSMHSAIRGRQRGSPTAGALQ